MYRDDLIRGRMAARKITVQQLAASAQVSVPRIVEIRKGSPNLMLPTLERVALALGFTMQELFTPATPEQEMGVAA